MFDEYLSEFQIMLTFFYLIVGLLQHALTLFSQDSTTAPPSSPKESGSPQSPRSTGSPKTKKSSGNMFQFPFREGRPSLSEVKIFCTF